MSRGDQIVRQWNLLRLLQTRGEGVALRQLAGEFDVSDRTIQRDFEILQELGFPIEHEDDPYGKRFWRMPHDFFRTGPLVLSLTEAISLHLAGRVLTPLAGTHLGEALQTVLEKIRSQLSNRALDYFAGLDDVVHVRRSAVTDYARHADAIGLILEAARSEQTVEVRYRSLWRGAEYRTLFDPYGLVYYDADLFAVGRSHRAGAVRILKVMRILSADPTDATFTRPADFSLEAQFHSSFGIVQPSGEPVEIVVKFTGPIAEYVEERVWHESQQLAWQPAQETLFEPAPDEPDALLATYRLGDVAEFKRWIRGFGPSAEVLRPDWLREEVRDEHLAAARKHGG